MKEMPPNPAPDETVAPHPALPERVEEQASVPGIAPPPTPAAPGIPNPAEVTPALIASAITRMMAESGGASAPAAPPAAPGPEEAEAPAPSAAGRPGIGVLLVNLGTPDEASPRAVRRYLREFLADPRVIERPTLSFRLVLNLFILPLRPMRKARAYRSIWNKEKNESPLMTTTRGQAEKLQAALADVDGGRIRVDWAMRYGNPVIADRIDALKAAGCDRILVVPLYPQYSSATTATVGDAVFRKLMRARNQPALRIAPAWYEDPVYIDALAASLRAHVAKIEFEPEVILASFHGMPREYVDKGDPYEAQCIRTTELLRQKLGRGESELMLTFQSRFGRAEWLKPYTDAIVKALAKRGIKRLVIITPGFTADCLETLEEIAVENAHIFKRAGGEKFAAVPCLNDSEEGMRVLRAVVGRELQGWV